LRCAVTQESHHSGSSAGAEFMVYDLRVAGVRIGRGALTSGWGRGAATGDGARDVVRAHSHAPSTSSSRPHHAEVLFPPQSAHCRTARLGRPPAGASIS
jgi:hypothetical protein